MSYETILYETADNVATITLNRPDSLNAFNDQMIGETTDAFKQAGRDKAVRCVVITGSGRGFSSGQDLADVQAREGDFSIGDHLRHGYHRLIKQMVRLEKPIVAAVNGVAAGAGCGVALAADLRLASDKASFILAFSRVGLVPDSGTTGCCRALLVTAVPTNWPSPPTGSRPTRRSNGAWSTGWSPTISSWKRWPPGPDRWLPAPRWPTASPNGPCTAPSTNRWTRRWIMKPICKKRPLAAMTLMKGWRRLWRSGRRNLGASSSVARWRSGGVTSLLRHFATIKDKL
jgi:hypothetical protein